MHIPFVRRAWPAILVLALSGGACAGQPATPAAATPAVNLAASPTSTGRPTAPPPSVSVPGVPPEASLAVEGGDPVVGQLGSYTWQGGGSDSPWLPGTPIKAAVGEPMTVTIGAGVTVDTWTVSRVVAGTSDGTGAIGLGSGTDVVSFPAPESGSWSVQVAVRFTDDLGSAAYYWGLTVP